MIDHLGIRVANYERSKRFYAGALAPLGYCVIMEFGGATAGLGADGKPDFWISQGEASGSIHIALLAKDRATVAAFHRAALAAGGRDNGAPGLRPEYHAGYYGAFVFDPDGNNVEAICHRPE